MNPRLCAFVCSLAIVGLAATPVWAEDAGQADLNQALRVKITAEGLRELNQVIELLESALDKGLDVENSDFAEQVLSESLFERATQLATVVDSVPEENLADGRMQRIRALAVSDLRRVVMYDEPPPQATTMLAELLAMPGGDRREARGLLDKLIAGEAFAAMPADEQAETLALRASLQRDAKKALADFARAIDLAPTNAEYRLARAQFQFDNDDVDAALAEIAAVVEKTPDQVSAYLLQAQILRAVKRYDEALKSLDKVAAMAPNSIVPYEYRGEIYREMGEYEKAIAEFTRILDIEPGMDLALLRRAETYLLAEKFDEALADADAVIKSSPNLALAHALRAQALAANDRFTDAIAEMKLLADELPGQPDVRMQLALYYLLNNQPHEAIAAYSEVIELDGENFLALRSRGDAYLNIGNHAAAVEDFDRALELDPEDSALLNNFAWVLATSPDDDVRDGKRAIELATRASELTKFEKPHILSTLAAAYAESGDFEHAREWSQKAVDFNDPVHGSQLEKELASYQAEKPWREKQTLEDATADDSTGVGDEDAEDAVEEASDDNAASDGNVPADDAADPEAESDDESSAEVGDDSSADDSNEADDLNDAVEEGDANESDEPSAEPAESGASESNG